MQTAKLTPMIIQHKRQMHPKVKPNEVPRTRPIRLAARR